MVMKKKDKICLGCKHFRPTTESKGKCRVDRATIDQSAYPEMRHDDSCSSWLDAGQQYFIRLGWVKSRINNRDSATE